MLHGTPQYQNVICKIVLVGLLKIQHESDSSAHLHV